MIIKNERTMKKLHRFYQSSYSNVIFAFIACFLAKVIISPLVVTNLPIFSLFEFFLIYILLKDTNKTASVSNWFKHMVNDCYSVFKFVTTLSLYCFSAFGILPFLLGTSSVLPSIAIQTISIYLVVKTYLGLQLLLLALSKIIDKPVYEYCTLMAILSSVCFAALTDMAAGYITINLLTAAVLYFASIIPLLYFVSVANDSVVNNSDVQKDAYFIVGSASLIMHIIEALGFIASLAFPSFRVAADIIRLPSVQIAVNTATTTACGMKLFNVFAETNTTNYTAC